MLLAYWVYKNDCWFVIENGVTAAGFSQSDEDFDDLGLTKFGKKHTLKILPEAK